VHRWAISTRLYFSYTLLIRAHVSIRMIYRKFPFDPLM
jgi:hypothetical protein